MRRKLRLAAVAGVGALALALTVLPFLSLKPAPVVAAPPEAAAGRPALPIAQVVLFSSGVGYFQREGSVEGSARIDLSFRVEDINDLIKSMVLQDMGGGRVSAVSYDSHDPIQKTLRSYAVNLDGNPSFSQILNQVRGERVEAVLQQSATTQPGTLTGTIVGVESQKQQVGKDGLVEVEVLNLWCTEGMRTVKLSDLQRLRFLNPVMENEVRRALDTLSLSHDTQKKAVSLLFSGEGKRDVKVSYVVENPIWKTSYRLVIGKDGKPFLQGWAIVENPSDEDWSEVRMGLVSGRPISFRMDLYQPLYVPRPVVEPELFASLRPPTYSGNMNYNISRVEEVSAPGPLRDPEAVPPPPGFGLAGGMGGGLLGRSGATKDRPANASLMNDELGLDAGIATAASGKELGSYFQYAINHPVTLPRQKSALLPIVNQAVEGTKVSIYNEAVQAKHPLLGLRFKNTTDLHLMQGPITVFEVGTYAGDARIEDLQPKEERLLSYAIDLGTEVEAVVPDPTDRMTKVIIKKGIIQATHRVQQSKTYNAKNRTEHDRALIVEHPYRPEFTLVTPEKATERARDVYRFDMPVAKGKTASLTVTEQRDVRQEVTLTNANDQSIKIFLSSTVVSDAVKDALKQSQGLKAKLAATLRELAHVNQQLNDIVQDQGRLRANLKEMPPTAEAYKRYLKKFDEQETEIEKLRDSIKQLQNQEHQQRNDYDTFLLNLNVE